MAAALEDTSVTYEDLADIERDFEEVEVEIIRQQIALTAPLYEQRQKITSKIPNFWPLVLEQAPPDIDQFIQPSDSALLLSALTSFTVSHFEVGEQHGDPRSVSMRWEFAANEHFEDSVLEKKFWFRRRADGWSGLVSEPVAIRWKSKDKDLTAGLLELVVEAWEEEAKTAAASTSTNGQSGKKTALTPKQKTLKKKIEGTGMGGLSFFAWFGFIGRRVTAEESQEATRLENEKRTKRKNGEKAVAEKAKAGEDENDDDDDDPAFELEIFPEGDDLALALSDDLWPGAIKYFTQAQEQDALSDADFESDVNIDDLDDDEEGEDDDDDELPASKRQKSS